MNAPIFIIGISPRSGTNFLYDLLRLHPDVDVAKTVAEDFLLFGAHHLQDYVAHVSRRWDMDWGMSETDRGELLRDLGEAGLQFLKRRQRHPELRLLTKTPEAHNLPAFFELFPDAQLIVLVRDGRAVVESKTKSFEAEFANAAKNWDQAARLILDFENATPPDKFRIIKYEDLCQHTDECVRSLLNFLELDPAAYPFGEMNALPVRGSSVFHGSSGKLDWKPVEKTAEFRPLERFSHWTPAQHSEFNLIAGEALERMGYPLAQTLYIKADIAFTPHDDEHDLVTRLDTGSKVLMPKESCAILDSFNKFKSLGEHFRRSTLVQEEQEKFVGFSQACIRADLLRSSDDFSQGLREKKKTDTEVTEDKVGIFIRTCDRPDFLNRILTSLETSGHTRSLDIYVLDDSRSQEVQQKNAGVIAAFNKGQSREILYLGQQWQTAFIHRMAQVFPHYENLIRFMLEPRPEGVFSAGRLVNIAMLAFAGRRMLTYDDDYILDRAWQHPEASTNTVQVTDKPAHCLEGFETEEDLANSVEALTLDPLQQHLDLLGKSVSEATTLPQSPLNKAFSLRGMSTRFASRLGPTSRILTTGNGVMGRPIAPDASLGWFAPPEDTVPVWARGKNYRAWVAGNHIFESGKTPSIAPITYGMPAGIDNSQLTPPTIPTGKREDTLFAFLMHHMHQSSVHLEMPWAIAHMREARDWRGATVDTPVGICLAQIIMASAFKVLPEEGNLGSAEAMLIMMGAALSERSTLPGDGLRCSVSSIFQEITSAHRRRVMDLLGREDIVNEELRTDLEKALELSQQVQMRPTTLPPLEDAHCPAQDSAQLQWLQQELQLFGQSLIAWPVLWAYCKDNPEIVALH